MSDTVKQRVTNCVWDAKINLNKSVSGLLVKQVPLKPVFKIQKEAKQFIACSKQEARWMLNWKFSDSDSGEIRQKVNEFYFKSELPKLNSV
jgi:hypothetical protein